MLKHALLGFLSYGPMTGYELKQTMDGSTSYFWHAKQSQIYTTLKRMEQDGLVASEIEPQEKRPDRRVYSINPAGQAMLREWLDAPLLELDQRKELFLLKMFFSASVNKETLLTQLRLQRDLHQKRGEHYRNDVANNISVHDREGMHNAKDLLMWGTTLTFGQRYEAMYVDWLDDLIELVETNF
ncbi:MAG: PadR family transcriptional regulator [Chloroflexi bacterium]|nr:MAG: PadR family transcriptional regulator [Chloroflexota bacterium]MBL1194077.1 PadR family transcriptional regulator [Chloroflexota bacterium]NOH11371.1 PadR family transcriptional regulator [Chloroflexota bacterium]